MNISLSWDQLDEVNEVQMFETGHKMMAELGLQDHQYMIYKHNDTDHSHIHVMVNRVHPEIEKATFVKQLHKRLDDFQRRTELENGWRFVPGKLTRPERLKQAGKEPEKIADLTGHVRRSRADRVLFNAESWQQVHQELEDRGVGVRLAGRGGQIYSLRNPDQSIKLTDISQKLSLSRMEKRLGEFELQQQPEAEAEILQIREETPPVDPVQDMEFTDEERELIRELKGADKLKELEHWYESRMEVVKILRGEKDFSKWRNVLRDRDRFQIIGGKIRRFGLQFQNSEAVERLKSVFMKQDVAAVAEQLEKGENLERFGELQGGRFFNRAERWRAKRSVGMLGRDIQSFEKMNPGFLRRYIQLEKHLPEIERKGREIQRKIDGVKNAEFHAVGREITKRKVRLDMAAEKAARSAGPDRVAGFVKAVANVPGIPKSGLGWVRKNAKKLIRESVRGLENDRGLSR
jgi:hypothetical protein